ncbi:MAG: hypothetical protein V1787_03955 [Candidatus Micrarchaeota archaeon]
MEKQRSYLNLAILAAVFIAVWLVVRTAVRGELGSWSTPVLAVFFLVLAWLWWRQRKLKQRGGRV